MLENAQAMAARSPRTTKPHDRTGDEITLDEVERITHWRPDFLSSLLPLRKMTAWVRREKKPADVSDRGKSSDWPSGG
jgi:hypothetical protein